MRLLIYSMQSSGASTVAFTLAQRPDCAAFVDVWAPYAAPVIAGPVDAIAKVVVTTAFPLSLHRERFRPDRTILLLRHPLVNYRSLKDKAYRHHCGFMEEKFALLDEVFARGTDYDAIVYFEDFVFAPRGVLNQIAALGWPCEPDFLKLSRKLADMVAFNRERLPDLTDRLEYGQGNYRGGYVTPTFAGLTALSEPYPMQEQCPRVDAHYRNLVRERERQWHLSDNS